MEGTAHPEQGQAPEALEAKPELTPVERYERFFLRGEPEGDEGGEAGNTGGQPEPDPEPAPEPQPEPPRKLKYKAHGEEREATEEEAAEALAGHADYMRNIQAVREQEAALKADKALLDFVRSNPQAQQALMGVMQPQQAPADDPVAAFKAEMRRELLQELAPLQQTVHEGQRERVRNHILRELNAHYGEDGPVIEGMVSQYIDDLPPVLRKSTLETLMSSPQAMAEGLAGLYQKMHPVARQRREAGQANQNAQPPDAKAKVKQEAARRHAPQLEGAGAAAGDNGANRATLMQEKRKILARIGGGDIRPNDSLRLMEITDILAGR